MSFISLLKLKLNTFAVMLRQASLKSQVGVRAVTVPWICNCKPPVSSFEFRL